jgi:hypothetical protein
MTMKIDPAHIAYYLSRTPAWARKALTAADKNNRERALDTIAAILSERLAEPAPPNIDTRQLLLPNL